MAHVLKILEGNQAGVSILLGATLTVGRTTGDFLIKDSKASGSHARVNWDGKNYTIQDLGSSNGTRVKGKSIQSCFLEVGSTFQIGQTLFQLSEQNSEVAKSENTAESSIAPAPPAATWQSQTLDYIKNWLPDSESSLSRFTPAALARPFERPLRLNVKSGLKFNAEFNLLWGPRILTDQHQLDLVLHDSDVSPLLLTFFPKKFGALLVATFPENLEVNGKAGKQFSLISGDEIAFGQTLITVSFEEQTNE